MNPCRFIFLGRKTDFFILSEAKTSDEVIVQAAEKFLEAVDKIVVDPIEGGIREA